MRDRQQLLRGFERVGAQLEQMESDAYIASNPDDVIDEDSCVSIVIPTKNEQRIIHGCLEACVAQTQSPHEIIIVDNQSSDKTTEVVKQFAESTDVNVRLLASVQTVSPALWGGITPTRNIGFDCVEGKIIGRIDADTIVAGDWVESIKKIFIENQALVAIGGLAGIRGISPPGRFWGRRLSLEKHRQANGRSYTEHLFGHNMAIRKSAWIKAKPLLVNFNDNDISSLEDLDLSLALAKIGKTKIDDRMVAKIILRRSLPLGKRIYYESLRRSTVRKHLKNTTQD